VPLRGAPRFVRKGPPPDPKYNPRQGGKPKSWYLGIPPGGRERPSTRRSGCLRSRWSIARRPRLVGNCGGAAAPARPPARRAELSAQQARSNDPLPGKLADGQDARPRQRSETLHRRGRFRRRLRQNPPQKCRAATLVQAVTANARPDINVAARARRQDQDALQPGDRAR